MLSLDLQRMLGVTCCQISIEGQGHKWSGGGGGGGEGDK